MSGDIWAVPYMPRERWKDLPRYVWDAAERITVDAGYGGKIKQARQLCGSDSIDPPIRGRFSLGAAELADDLGAPIGQAFTVAAMRDRRP